MSMTTETQTRRERSVLYVVASVALVILLVAGVIFYSSAKSTAEAEDKADQLIAALDDAGARTPDRDQIVRVLGDDGGATCENPNDALSRATLFAVLTNGSGGPGSRPVVVDSRVFKGQLLIISIYCPEELEDFQDFVDDLKTGDVAGD